MIDGSGGGGRVTDIAVLNGKITKIGDLSAATAGQLINASGKIVTPGFIDIHTHSDRGIKTLPSGDNYVLQGVTTILGGNCGGGCANVEIATFLKDREGSIGLNFGTLIGFGDIRSHGMTDRTAAAPTQTELATMKDLMKRAMLEGAFGISTGLEYIPDRFASTDEVVEIVKVAASYGGFYATHSRDEQGNVLTSVGEAIEIGRKSGARVQISHLKPCGAEVWGYGKIMISMITEARAMGLDITADHYPYGAASTGFYQIYPAWSLEGGIDRLKERLADPALKTRIQAYCARQIRLRVGEDYSLIQIAGYKPNKAWEGKTMKDALAESGKAETMDKLLNLAHEMFIASGGNVSILYHHISEDDIQTIMRSPYVMFASDGDIRVFGDGAPHPRSYGTFPRVLRRYVNELYIISPEEAIRKMTSFPALKMKLPDRGLLKEGYWADIVVYDEHGVKDMADYLNPHQYAAGIDYVVVNGKVAADHGRMVNQTAGMVLYGPGKK